jgi:hypothetical protein
MPDHDPALDDAIREISNLFAITYRRLRFPDPPSPLDSVETESDSCDDRLTT